MPYIPKIHIALRQIPSNIEARVRESLSNPKQYKLGKEEDLALEFSTTKDFLSKPPGEIFFNYQRPFSIVVDAEEIKPEELSKLIDEEKIFRQNVGVSEPRIILFKSVVPQSLIKKQQFGPDRLQEVSLIDDVFKDYRELIDQGFVSRASSLDAAVNIAVANIIRASMPAEPVVKQLHDLIPV